MAHAARRAGHPSTLDQIRVDVLAGLLDGTLHHLDRDQIIAHLLTHRSGNDDPRQTDRPAPGDVHEGVTGSTGDSASWWATARSTTSGSAWRCGWRCPP